MITPQSQRLHVGRYPALPAVTPWPTALRLPLVVVMAAGVLLGGCRRSQDSPVTTTPTTPPMTPTTEAAEPSGPSGSAASDGPSRLPQPKQTALSGDLSEQTIVPKFTNAAQSSGIDFSFYPDLVEDRFFLPEVMGGGAGWLDVDRDGLLDLYLVNGAVLQPAGSEIVEHRNGLFRSGGTRGFDDVSAVSSSNDAGYGQGCMVGDFNADGFPDLYVSNYGPNVLLVNNGDGTFSDATEPAGVGDPRWGSSGVWVDLNQDSLLDLFVVNYLDVTFQNHKVCLYGDKPGYCGPGRYEGVPDLVYLNAGDGTFREAAEELGFNPFPAKGLAIAVSDFNDDLLPDLYVANDMTANFLYTRSRVSDSGELTVEPVYRDIAQQSGCAVSGDGINEASMGIACADFNSDGLSDLYLTHYYQMKNTLYRNLGGLMFEDDSLRTGVAAQSFEFLGFGTTPLDFNGDGAPDLFVANGHVLGPRNHPNAMTPQLLQNDGQGNFSDISAAAGDYFQNTWLGRGVAAGDYDNDGDVDLAVTHLDKPVALLRNDTPTNRQFLGLSLQQLDRMPPVCARVTVIDGPRRLTQIVSAGGSYLSSSDSRLTFALTAQPKSSAAVVKVEIQWPSSRIETHGNLTPGKYWRIVEGRPPETLPE